MLQKLDVVRKAINDTLTEAVHVQIMMNALPKRLPPPSKKTTADNQNNQNDDEEDYDQHYNDGRRRRIRRRLIKEEEEDDDVNDETEIDQNVVATVLNTVYVQDPDMLFHNEMVLNRHEKKNDPRRRRIMRYLHLKKKKKKKTTTKKTKRRRGMSRNSTTNKTSFALPNKPPPLTVVIHQKILSMPCLTRKLSFSQTTNIGVDMCVGCSLSLSLSLSCRQRGAFGKRYHHGVEKDPDIRRNTPLWVCFVVSVSFLNQWGQDKWYPPPPPP